MIHDYEVKHAVQIAGEEVIFAENENVADRYMVCDCSWNNPLGIDLYKNSVGSADFAEMMVEFSSRISARATEVMAERMERGIPYDIITVKDCCPKDNVDLEGQVVVIKPEKLAPEYRYDSYQLALCTGGFGSKPESRGRAVFCQNLYTGKTDQWNRDDIAGTMSPDRLPDWAKEKLDALRNPTAKESVTKKIKDAKKMDTPKDHKPKAHNKGGPEL